MSKLFEKVKLGGDVQSWRTKSYTMALIFVYSISLSNMYRLAILALALQASMVAAMPANKDNAKRQMLPMATTVINGKTSYLYGLAVSSIPASLATQLQVPALPTDIPLLPSETVVTYVQTTSTSVGFVPVSPVPAAPQAPVAPSTNFTDGFTGYRSVGYYPDWYVYDRKFNPDSVIVDQFTHLIIPFADIRRNGEVYHVDKDGEFNNIYSKNPSTVGGAVHGVTEDLFRMKSQKRDLKLMLGIGGWTYSQGPHQLPGEPGNFSLGCDTPEKRATFAKSAVQLVNDMGYDGVDIDWEYPRDATEGQWLSDLVRLTRLELDGLSKRLGAGKFLLSVAVSVDPAKLALMNISEMDKHLDFWSVMGYDFAGTFSTITQHASNLFPTGDSKSAFSLSQGVDNYINAGINPRKLNIGVPIYAHGFLNTDGFGSSFVQPQKEPPHGDWDQVGFYDYNSLEQKWIPDGELFEDEEIGAAWLYSKNSRNLFSFDTPKIVEQKAKWMVERGLGGMMWWQLNADKFDVWSNNLIESAVRVMSRDNFEKAQNHLSYPNSKWPNIATPDNVLVVPVHPSFLV
ncbi:hypothetical protein TWF694_010830 [Orbilia ellipsospora]|uniref:chitinase n=1 Tax=Orbilia ellipsospora TaxID=2528407 RepID=A0AAV9X865_9PEZI